MAAKPRRRNHRAEIKPTPPAAPSKYSQAEILDIMGRFIQSGGKHNLKDDSKLKQAEFLFT
ncbi:hypothetical protein ACFL02_01785 [Planctomycetota bacterium]